MSEPEPTRCWSCRTRRLVCDSSRPACSRCLQDGIPCPGYGAKKPFKWLPTGEYRARPRRLPPASPSTRPKPRQKPGRAVRGHDRYQEAGAAAVPQVLKLSHDNLEEGIAYALRTYIDWMRESFVQRAHISIVESTLENMDNFSPEDLQCYRIYALEHYLFSNRKNPNLDAVSRQKLNLRLLHHRATGFQMMNDSIARYRTPGSPKRTSNAAAVIIKTMFLFAEYAITFASQPGGEQNWRPHVYAALSTIQESITSINDIPAEWYFSVHGALCIAALANTTSPSSNQIMPRLIYQHVDWMADYYEILAPPLTGPWPGPLLNSVIRINLARAEQSPNLSDRALIPATILSDVARFSPAAWAQEKKAEHTSLWTSLAHIMRAAVGIYAHATLLDRPLDNAHREHLFTLLSAAPLSRTMVRRTLVWPLVVMGFAAKFGSLMERDFVRTNLPMIAEDHCQAAEDAADLLEQYWESPRNGWDECFYRPCAFCA